MPMIAFLSELSFSRSSFDRLVVEVVQNPRYSRITENHSSASCGHLQLLRYVILVTPLKSRAAPSIVSTLLAAGG